VGAIQVKNVPADLHRRLRERAAAEGASLGQYILATLERDLATPGTREWLERVRQDPATPVTGEQIAESLRRARDERDEQLLRAVRH
jgi:plasmid stability protein